MSTLNQPTLVYPLPLSLLLIVWVIFFKKTYFCQYFKQNTQDIFSYPFFRSFQKQHAILKHIYQNVAVTLMSVKMKTCWFKCVDMSEGQFQEIQRALWCTKGRGRVAPDSLLGRSSSGNLSGLWRCDWRWVRAQDLLCLVGAPLSKMAVGILQYSKAIHPRRQQPSSYSKDLQRFTMVPGQFVIRNDKLLPICEPNVLGVESI